MYGLANGNATAAQRLYMEQYSNRRVLSHILFKKIHQHLCEFGLREKFVEVLGLYKMPIVYGNGRRASRTSFVDFE